MKVWWALSWNDQRSILLLLTLYTLQGIPLGLSGSIPIIMRENGVSYENISIFSLVSLPFSLKLLWAPLVDSIYLPSIGRRKSWLIPIQTLTGLILLFGSSHVPHWIENHDTSSLIFYFFLLYLMMATQDIAVDGWALTLLSRENVAYGTVCNAIGQTFGFILANQGFLIFSDRKWCRDVLGLHTPLLDLSSFMFFWGLFFLFLTFLLFFITESTSLPLTSSLTTLSSPSTCTSLISPISWSSIGRTYTAIYEICRLHAVQKLMIILLTSKLSLGPCDAVSIFKLQEYGMPRSDIAILSPVLLLISFSLPVLLGPILASHPLDLFWKGLFLKLFSTISIWILFQFLSSSSSIIQLEGTSIPTSHPNLTHYPPFRSYFFIFSAIMIFNEIASNIIFNSQMSFFSKIADPSIGGTYMTLLNTLANLGTKWPNFLSLYLLPSLSSSICRYDRTNIENQILESVHFSQSSSWSSSSSWSRSWWSWNFFKHCSVNFCQDELEGKCEILVDGYTLEQHLGVIIGICWLLYFVKTLKALETVPLEDWGVTRGGGGSEGDPLQDHIEDLSINKKMKI
jgi:MFS transporter, PAT family, solute carrier family 33 (acetyl-CoA transportor), member 1